MKERPVRKRIGRSQKLSRSLRFPKTQIVCWIVSPHQSPVKLLQGIIDWPAFFQLSQSLQGLLWSKKGGTLLQLVTIHWLTQPCVSLESIRLRCTCVAWQWANEERHWMLFFSGINISVSFPVELVFSTRAREKAENPALSQVKDRSPRHFPCCHERLPQPSEFIHYKWY